MRIQPHATGFSPASPLTQAGAVDPLAELGAVAPQADEVGPDIDDAPNDDTSLGSNPFAQALAASTVLPLANSAGFGPAKIENFSATASPAAAASSVYAVVTKGADTVAVIDSAGNVSVRSPASDATRDAMSQLSDPAARTAALAEILGGTAESPAGQANALPAQLQALTLTSPMTTATTTVTAAASGGPSQSDIAQADSDFASLFDSGDPNDALQQITSDGLDGYWRWQLKQLTSQIASQVMSALGVTRDQVASMPPQQRIDLENKIVKAVEQRVEQIIKEEMKRKKADQAEAGLATFQAASAAKKSTDPAPLTAPPEGGATKSQTQLFDLLLG